jgi:hypothetical protein
MILMSYVVGEDGREGSCLSMRDCRIVTYVFAHG